jgi:GNAT superfamily N-acetyltransferase
MVAERFRRRGLATHLLDNTRATLAKAGCRELRLAYPKSEALEPAMLKLCSNERGWQPSDGTVLYSCTVAEVPAFVASLKPYVDRFTALAPLHCIAYRDLNAQQVRQAVRQWKPPYWAVPPIPGERSDGWGTFDDLISQGLLLNDALVGWCLCHRISETAHRMTVAYVGETFQRKGWMMLPVLKAVQTLEDWNAQQGKNPDHGIRFGVQAKNKAMIHFAERRIKPFALKTTLTVERVTKLP